MSFEPLALWKSNFAEVGFPTRKPLKAWALIFQLRISGLDQQSRYLEAMAVIHFGPPRQVLYITQDFFSKLLNSWCRRSLWSAPTRTSYLLRGRRRRRSRSSGRGGSTVPHTFLRSDVFVL
jgi:hypothetical protein